MVVLCSSYPLSSLGAKSNGKTKANVQVRAKVDTHEVAYGETFILSVVVKSHQEGKALPPQLPPLKAFELLRDWTHSSVSTQIIHDGRGMKSETIRQKVFSYELRLKKSLQKKKTSPSIYNIDPIKVRFNGKRFFTQKISIKAVDSAQARQGPSRRNKRRYRGLPHFFSPSRIEDWMRPFSAQSRESKLSQEDLDKSFFIHLDINKTRVFVGEMLHAKWYIYTLGQVRQLERVQFPKLKGFWKEEIESAPRLRFEPTTVNGLPYQRALLASHMIFPLKVGQATVDSYRVKAKVLLGTKDKDHPFGNFLAQSYSLSRQSEALEMDVLPLPPLPPGHPFVGGVGSFELTAQVDASKVPLNEPFAFKVRFSGKGNAKRIKAPPLKLPPQLEIYNQSSQAKFFKNGNSYKEFEFLLIPKSEPPLENKDRELVLNPLKVRVFDPYLKKYQELTTSPISLQLMEESSSPSPSQTMMKRFFAPPSDLAHKSQKKGLPPLLSSWQKGEPRFWWKPFFVQWWLWLVLALLGGSGLLFYAYRQQLLFPPKKKNRKQEFQQRWQQAQTHFEQRNWPQLGVDLCNLVYFILLPQGGGVVSSSQVGNLQTLLQHSPPSVQKTLKQPLLELTHFFQGLSFKQHRSHHPLSKEDEKAIREKMHQLKRILLRFPHKGFH